MTYDSPSMRTATAGGQNGSDTAVRTPSIELPRGGGAIRGIGEKFGTNPVSGTASLTIPIAMSGGRSGFGPKLTLSYDSGSGNGPFGFGWTMDLPTVTRRTDRGGPRYRDPDESDVYLLSSAEDLVPVLDATGRRFDDDTARPGYSVRRFRPRIEGLFARIERWTHRATGTIHWRSISRDNITTLYGTSGNSRVADPADPHGRIFSWLICESYDDNGNAVVYQYAAENDLHVDTAQPNERNRLRTANRYLKRIIYGNRTPNRDPETWAATDPNLEDGWLFETVFDYDEGRFEEVALDPRRASDEQLRYVRVATSDASPDWAVRPDPFSWYRSGFEIRTYRRCRRVLMFHRFAELGDEPCLVRSTDFEYADFDAARAERPEDELAHQGSTRFASFMRSATHSGYVREESCPVEARDGLRFVTYLKKSMPPLELEYSRPIIDPTIRELDPASLENLPIGLDGTRFQWVDLDGEGVPGILTQQAAAWFYKPNTGGGHFGPQRRVATEPSLGLYREARQQLLDLAGDGHLDVVSLSGPVSGFYERSDDDWDTLRTLPELPNLDWDDPNLRLVDLTGDGRADVLITRDDAFTWHPSLAEDGFGPAERLQQPWNEEEGPRVILADRTESVYLADMSGDGLADLVRIRNGEVSYWPSLGYGRFGAKVTMDNSPWFDGADQFEQQRIRLADIDGSGTTDIIYLGRDGLHVFFNQAGNRLSAVQPLIGVPLTNQVSSVTVVDLLGNGTGCVVWSSPLPGEAGRPLRYIDLMGGQKPHLLVACANNLGVETHITYAASTRFFLNDRANGRPWITKVPFPVHVVERTETYDRVSDSRMVSRFAYHHGYFDGVEREFRGFGLVERWDTEAFAALASSDRLPVGANVEASSHVPPALTRTWFHTGSYRGREHVSDFYAGLVDGRDRGVYYRPRGLSDAQARRLLLEDTVLPAGLSIQEEREACRSLKGSMLRQEVYAYDGTAFQDQPYTVTEQNLTVRLVQRQGPNRNAVFFTHARETLSYHYERRPADPRIRHAMTLEVDDFGNVLKYAAAGYGRQHDDPGLGPEDQAIQRRDLVSYTENDVTNGVDTSDSYRVPLPCGSRTYEITGLVRSPGGRLTGQDVLAAGTGGARIAYEQRPTTGLVERRLIEHVRTLYRRDDLTGPLPHGTMQALALPFETYRLAFTPSLLAAVYGDRVTDAMLAGDGRYLQNQADDNWWLPTGQVFYSPDPSAEAGQELAHARAHFFLPHRYRDALHTDALPMEAVVSYDYDLLLRETCDALGNRVTAGERNVDPSRPLVRSGQQYRVLQAAIIMDPNRNRSMVAFDALGLVVGSATMGAPEDDPVPGDRLTASFRADLTEAEIARFRVDPKGPIAADLVDEATSRVVYDLDAYRRTSEPGRAQPIFAATLSRETHASEPAPPGGLKLQVSFSYSDGFGREIQKKVQAEPGPVPRRDAAEQMVSGTDGSPMMTDDDVSPRWLGTGWTIFNNKGKPVRKFEPFFSATHHFERDVRIGVSPVLFYDPLERVVATLHPNHTWEKVVVDPWGQETWDVNDTILVLDPRTDPDVGDYFQRLDEAELLPTWYGRRVDGALGGLEQAAARKAAIHAATPSTAHSDSMGRAFLTVARNRARYSETRPGEPPVETLHRTRIIQDVEGHQREVVDAAARTVIRYDFNMAGSRIHEASMEAGERWTLGDAGGQSIYAWDSRGNRLQTVYDALRRPTEVILREGGGAELRVAQTVYGESQANPEVSNLRTKIVQAFDQAGVATTDQYDFKGNAIRSARQLARAYSTLVDWSAEVPLHAETFAGTNRFDALNRPVELVEPDGTRVYPAYNEASLLERVEANLHGAAETTTFVAGIDYNAKGKRTRIEYGNGAQTTYTYDPLTFQLVHLVTRRNAARFPEDCPDPQPAGWPGCEVQNLRYTHDPIGNITHIRDDAQQTVYFRNTRVDPSADYTYDALYRLIEATGREHLGQIGGPPTPYSHSDAGRLGRQHPEDGNALGRYLERYAYDVAGNITSLAHHGSDSTNPGWTRTFAYHEPSALEPDGHSNRLTSTTVGATTETYSVNGDGYDSHGGMLRLPHLPTVAWDFRSLLRMTQQQAVRADDQDGDALPGERTWYVYDGAGARVRKVTERANGQVKDERVYFGSFEVYRKHGANPLVRQTLHIMDDKQRVALVETRTEGDDPAPAELIRYQLGNHLGSVGLELDERARVISYEEFSPYGSTTYQARRSRTETPKRYRYTGKERDDETGFSYHGARYYAPWLCRWTTCDPAGLADGVNVYAYVSGRPLTLTDPTGMQGDAQEIMQGMMWDQMGRELSAMIEGVFGGHAYVSPRTNRVDYSGPEKGVGGMVGGVARAATFRIVPIERNATPSSLIGMEFGAGLVIVVDPGTRLVTGTTVTGQETSRAWAALQFGLDVLPFGMELHAMSMEARAASLESRVLSTEAEALNASHIGSSGTRIERPTVTNPTMRNDLCVADVGAHEANLRRPVGEPPITNTEFVEASGRPVGQVEGPIANTGEAKSMLQSGFDALHGSGRIAEPVNVCIPMEPTLQPGNYVAMVEGPMGEHALHATVTEEVIGKRFISEGRMVTESEAMDLRADNIRVVEQNVYRTEYYDPQIGACVQPTSKPRSFLKLE